MVSKSGGIGQAIDLARISTLISVMMSDDEFIALLMVKAC